MSFIHDRTAADLTRAFAAVGVRTDITATDDGVIVPQEGAQRLLATLAFREGGNRLPFVNRLLQRAPAAGVHLRGDEGRHLYRALEDISNSRRRAEQIDRGQIPGALSGSEVMRLARKHPHMFGGGR